jgi:anaerobic nitric oxide reductase transcription regulator
VDVRVVAATNRDLREEVRAGRFRSDLYYRLGVYPLEVPPLRARRDDLALLSGHFLDAAQERLGLGQLRLSTDARRRLRDHDWPGNVRELEHTILRGAVRAAETRHGDTIVIERDHLGLDAVGQSSPADQPATRPLRDTVDAFTRQLIETTVADCGDNWAEAARRLGVQRGNLHRLATRLGMH